MNDHVQSLPGMGPKRELETVAFLLDNNHLMRRGIRIHKDTDDIVNVGKEFKLTAGLALVRVEVGANKDRYVDAGHADAPVAASVVEAVLLMESLSLHDADGVREDKAASGVIHGRVDETKVRFGTGDPTYINAIKAALKLVEFEKPAP